MQVRRNVLMALLVICTLPVLSAHAEDGIPLIAQQRVHTADVVTTGHPVGTPEFGLANTKTGEVHWFANAAACGLYAENPGKFPDVGSVYTVALHGADPVALFPKGVHDPAAGQVIAGKPEFATMVGDGVTYWFTNEANRAKFFYDGPAKYTQVAVGGYCLGAMARGNGDVVHGNPNYAFFVPEMKTWAIFGSPNGPVAWKAMTSAERLAAWNRAQGNYHRKTGLGSQIAGR